MNTAQVLVELLKEYQVKHIFGVPGDTTMVLYDALYAARGEITHIMARDERSAAFMADAYARLASKPGITEAPSGGGGPYLVSGGGGDQGTFLAMGGFTSYFALLHAEPGAPTFHPQPRPLSAPP